MRAPAQEKDESWPELILPDDARLPEIPTAYLPGVFGEMAAAVSAATQTPNALAVMVMLSVLAVAVQRGRVVRPNQTDYAEPLPIWTVTTMPSGSRKTAVLNALTRPLLEFDKRNRDRQRPEVARVFAARAVAKKRIEHLQQLAAKSDDPADRDRFRREIAQISAEMPEDLYPPRLFVADVTTERLQALLVENHGCISVLSDEGGIFPTIGGLYNGGQGALDTVLQGHSGSPIRIERQQRSAFIDAPRITLGLTVQPDLMAEVCASPKFRNSGFLARFLYAMPRSNLGTRNVRNTESVSEDISARYAAAINALLEQPGDDHVLTFDRSATDLWYDFSQNVESELGESGRFAHITDWAGKLPGQIARVAALMELGSGDPQAKVVRWATAQQAVALGADLIEHALAAFRLLGADQAEADAKAVMRWIQANALREFTRVEVHKGLEGRLRTAARVKIALERLAELHVIDGGRLRRNPGARPSHVHQVNPKFTAGYSDFSGNSP